MSRKAYKTCNFERLQVFLFPPVIFKIFKNARKVGSFAGAISIAQKIAPTNALKDIKYHCVWFTVIAS